jgi:hypothetical protein
LKLQLPLSSVKARKGVAVETFLSLIETSIPLRVSPFAFLTDTYSVARGVWANIEKQIPNTAMNIAATLRWISMV